MGDITLLILNGVLLGALYATMAYGIAIIWGVAGIANLAHGGILMFGAYITFWINNTFRLDPLLSIIFVMPSFFLVGMLIQKFLIKPIMDGPPISSLLLLFGLWLVIKNIAYYIWTGNERGILTPYTFKTINLGAQISISRLVVFIVAIISTLVLHLILKKTYIGKSIRAVSQDRESAMMMGVDVQYVLGVTFGLATAWTGLAGSLMSVIYSFNPEFGSSFLLKSFCIVVLGGLGSMAGVIVGSVILAIAESLSVLFLQTRFQEMISFIILVLILIVKPSGLLGIRQ